VSTKKNKRQVIGLLGVGLDSKDEHKRVTRNEDFWVVGGSQETHEKLQEVSIKFNEALHKRGQPLQEASIEVVVELLHEANDL
jgi:hypothetical protein